MMKAKTGRLNVDCPRCGTLKQLKLKDMFYDDDSTGAMAMVIDCPACQLKYEVVIPARSKPGPVKAGDAPVQAQVPVPTKKKNYKKDQHPKPTKVKTVTDDEYADMVKTTTRKRKLT